MGDRALIQFRKGQEVSPVVYLHWHGSSVSSLLAATKARMAGRDDDLSYVPARFIGVCHEKIGGNLSLGVWNADKALTAADSHGDAGCFVVDLPSWEVSASGGYGLIEGGG